MFYFLWNIIFCLFSTWKKERIFDKDYLIHHKSNFAKYGKKYHGQGVISGYTLNRYKQYELDNYHQSIIDNFYKILYNAKHIFIQKDFLAYEIGIYDKKLGWLTFRYYGHDCLEIHCYNTQIRYEIFYVDDYNENFSYMLQRLLLSEKNN